MSSQSQGPLAGIAIGMAAAAATFATGGAALPFVGAAYMAGSMAGNLLFAKGTMTKGARIEDQVVTTSAIGNTIPVLIGTTRVAGNLIWQSPLRESYKDEKMGKAMGSSKNRTYSYHRDFAILLSCNKVTDVTKMFAGGELIFDKTDKNKGKVKNFDGDYIFYDGSDDQLPDSTMESHEGIGNVNSMAGFCYIVFKNFDLTEYNGQVPNLTFQVVNTEDDIDSYNFETIENSNSLATASNYSTVSFNSYNNCLYSLVSGSSPKFIKYNCLTKKIDKLRNYTQQELRCVFSTNNEKMYFNTDGDLVLRAIKSGNVGIAVLDKNTLEIKNFYTGSSFIQYDSSLNFAFSPNTTYFYSTKNKRQYMIGKGNGGTNNSTEFLQLLEFDVTFSPMSRKNIIIQNTDKSINYSYYTQKSVDWGNFSGDNSLFAFVSSENNLYYANIRASYNSTYDLNRTLSLSRLNLDNMQIDEDFIYIINDKVASQIWLKNIILDENNEFIYIIYFTTSTGKVNIAKYSIYDKKIVYDNTVQSDNSLNLTYSELYKDEIVLTFSQYLTTNSQKFLFVNTETFEERTQSYSTDKRLNGNVNNSNVIFYNKIDESFSSFGIQTAGKSIVNNIYINRFSDGDFSVYKCIEILMSRIKTLDQSYYTIDEKLKSKKMRGLICSNLSETRSYLEQLSQYFFFDIILSDWKIKFIDQDRSISKTIKVEDLSCVEYSDDPNFSEEVSVTQASENETASLINLNYIDIDRDYQQFTQDAYRLNVDSDETDSVDAPFSMTADEAKQVAEKILYRRWIERSSYNFTTNLDYIEIDACDYVTVETEDFDYYMKITKIERDAGLIKFTATAYSSNVFEQSGKGSIGDFSGQSFTNISQTETDFLDIPIIRNEDDGFGFYVSANKQNDSLKWSGSSLYQSKNNDSVYNQLLSFSSSAKRGSTLTALQTEIFKGQYDPFSTVDVFMETGTLETISDSQFYNFENLAIIGNEIVAFQNADLISENTYRLSGFLRSKWNTDSTNHSTGERFIHLNYNDLRRYNSDFNDLSLNFYKNASIGESLSNANSIAFQNTNVGLKAYPVTDVGYNFNYAKDINITWKKRTRGNNNLIDGFDSNDLDGDNYEVEICKANSTVLKVFSLNTTSFTLTNAEWLALNTGSGYFYNIYKLNKYNERSDVYKLNIVI